jgi:hypothetical protein
MQAGIGPVADRGHLRGSGDLGTPRDRSPLWAKFPNQLGGREPIVRRTDLGAKGIYYRTMVGPFASMENAAGMCRTLKAASGNCLIQRNWEHARPSVGRLPVLIFETPHPSTMNGR